MIEQKQQSKEHKYKKFNNVSVIKNTNVHVPCTNSKVSNAFC